MLNRGMSEPSFTAVHPLVQEHYVAERARLRESFGMGIIKAPLFIKRNSDLVDTVIRQLYETAKRTIGSAKIAIVAVGGYGRKELFPYSDIDLLFLHSKDDNVAHDLTRWMLPLLWNMGLNVAQSVRTVEEIPDAVMQDIILCTSLLDSRIICGNTAMFTAFTSHFRNSVERCSAMEFVEAKLAERDARHARCGDSRYVLEPNIKDGKGGLRDIHTLYWLAKYIYAIKSVKDMCSLSILNSDECKVFIKANEFLSTVRTYLHLAAGRAEERVTFDRQKILAEKMGYRDITGNRAVEQFMKQYFLVAKNVGNLTRSVCAVLEESGKRKPRLNLATRLQLTPITDDFIVEGERLAIADEQDFRKNPVLLIKLFLVSHEAGLDIQPKMFQFVSRNLWLIDAALRRSKEANDAFMALLISHKNPEHTLRRMSDSGVMGKFIPEFGRVTGQMQFDMYHVYTVDEHTINAISILHNIGSGKYAEEMPLGTMVFRQIHSKRLLFLAILTHDIAKGRGGDHSVIGEVIVRRLARRFHLDAFETETCAWLVRNHLMMSRTAFKRDLGDEKTIADFMKEVQSLERLRLLLLLTSADIRAVGPGVWNGWKASLLRELYYAAAEKMGDNEVGKEELARNRLRPQLITLLPEWKTNEIDAYLSEIELHSHGFDAEHHVRIAHLMKAMQQDNTPLLLDTRSDNFRSVTEIILCTQDNTGLFSRTSGAIALAGANIVGAKIFTTKQGMAIQMFHIQDSEQKAFDKPDRLARLAVYLNKAVTQELDFSAELARGKLAYPSRMDVFKVPPRVNCDNKISSNHTVIEVSGRDRQGFLYLITNVLAHLKLNISTAHITTYGERAVDVFYVRDAFGMKITHENKLRQIQEELMKVIG